MSLTPQPRTKHKTNWLSVGAFISVIALLIMAFAALFLSFNPMVALIFITAVGFNGVITAILSFHLDRK